MCVNCLYTYTKRYIGGLDKQHRPTEDYYLGMECFEPIKEGHDGHIGNIEYFVTKMTHHHGTLVPFSQFKCKLSSADVIWFLFQSYFQSVHLLYQSFEVAKVLLDQMKESEKEMQKSADALNQVTTSTHEHMANAGLLNKLVQSSSNRLYGGSSIQPIDLNKRSFDFFFFAFKVLLFDEKEKEKDCEDEDQIINDEEMMMSNDRQPQITRSTTGSLPTHDRSTLNSSVFNAYLRESQPHTVYARHTTTATSNKDNNNNNNNSNINNNNNININNKDDNSNDNDDDKNVVTNKKSKHKRQKASSASLTNEGEIGYNEDEDDDNRSDNDIDMMSDEGKDGNPKYQIQKKEDPRQEHHHGSHKKQKQKGRLDTTTGQGRDTVKKPKKRIKRDGYVSDDSGRKLTKINKKKKNARKHVHAGTNKKHLPRESLESSMNGDNTPSYDRTMMKDKQLHLNQPSQHHKKKKVDDAFYSKNTPSGSRKHKRRHRHEIEGDVSDETHQTKSKSPEDSANQMSGGDWVFLTGDDDDEKDEQYNSENEAPERTHATDEVSENDEDNRLMQDTPSEYSMTQSEVSLISENTETRVTRTTNRSRDRHSIDSDETLTKKTLEKSVHLSPSQHHQGHRSKDTQDNLSQTDNISIHKHVANNSWTKEAKEPSLSIPQTHYSVVSVDSSLHDTNMEEPIPFMIKANVPNEISRAAFQRKLGGVVPTRIFERSSGGNCRFIIALFADSTAAQVAYSMLTLDKIECGVPVQVSDSPIDDDNIANKNFNSKPTLQMILSNQSTEDAEEEIHVKKI
ncbi:Zinc finger, C3HC4 type [Reticulomyxa filosa]|uniref:Zinc finger, C3HC4 type n=1 Tax=Reticulomyxa filosa TaxID=46433 RepID=X6NNT9_RETFI|nr:Zinc finger, C3HC4 type [Reticulomyxa filosa]|eukprot:ETO27042.1 Zinc finger, C3HC4 type [Reticulomyxa filosa]